MSLEFTQLLKEYDTLISLSAIQELNEMTINANGMVIGAAVPYSGFLSDFCNIYPEAQEMFNRLGSQQIRNAGTLGGSLGNASPIGDPAPLLLALQADVLLAGSTVRRSIPLSEFFTSYRQTVLKPGEVIVSVNIPPRSSSMKLACYKVSKRIEDDISSVLLAITYDLANGVMSNVHTGFGGMAATPANAPTLEQALENQTFSLELMKQAADKITDDFNPMTDVRASSHYRLDVCKNLLQRLWYEHSDTVKVRVNHAAL